MKNYDRNDNHDIIDTYASYRETRKKKQFYRKAWICGFVHLEEVPLKSADQRDGGVRKEPVDKGEVHLEIPFCTLFWI